MLRCGVRHGEDRKNHDGIARLDPAQTVFMAVFQYFIGNTDWSIRALHDIVLLTDSASRVLPVPTISTGRGRSPHGTPCPSRPCLSEA